MNTLDALLASVGAGTEILEPYDDGVLVRPIEREQQTAGGLYVPDTAHSEVAPVAVVVAVAPGLEPEKLEPGAQTVQPGERIAYMPGYGVPIDVADERLLIIPENAILGVYRRQGQ
jgi:chaperonin GroES